MAKNTTILPCLMMLLVLFDVTMGTQIYRVGDYFGWNNSTKVDYSQWSASKDFQVGDVLSFQFDPNNDNVFRVSAEDFAACRAPSPFGLPSDGQEFYPLDTPGRWYFICSIPGRCQSGQKLQILVHPLAPSAPSQPSSPTNPPAIGPAPAPAPSPINPPAPPQNNPSSSSSPVGSPLNESPSSGKLSPDHSPSNSPAGENSGSVAVPVNFWVAMAAVAVSVFSIARRNY